MEILRTLENRWVTNEQRRRDYTITNAATGKCLVYRMKMMSRMKICRI